MLWSKLRDKNLIIHISLFNTKKGWGNKIDLPIKKQN